MTITHINSHLPHTEIQKRAERLQHRKDAGEFAGAVRKIVFVRRAPVPNLHSTELALLEMSMQLSLMQGLVQSALDDGASIKNRKKAIQVCADDGFDFMEGFEQIHRVFYDAGRNAGVIRKPY